MHGHNMWKDIVLGLIILIVTIWPTILGATASRWVVIVAAALIVLHGFFCSRCRMHGEMPARRRR